MHSLFDFIVFWSIVYYLVNSLLILVKCRGGWLLRGFFVQDFLGKLDHFLEFEKQSNAGAWQLVYRAEVEFPHSVFLELIRQLILT